MIGDDQPCPVESARLTSLFWATMLACLPVHLSAQGAACPGGGPAEAQAFFAAHGGITAFPVPYRNAVTTFVQVERALCDNDLARARSTLDALWARQPRGEPAWDFDYRVGGAHAGQPSAYYALRMMDDIVAYEQRAGRRPPPDTAMLGVVLAACAEGMQPRYMAELRGGVGARTRGTLLPELRAENHRLVRESTALFRRYVEVITDGRLALAIRIIEHGGCIPVNLGPRPWSSGPVFFSPDEAAMYANAPPGLEDADWLWLIVPSLTPAAVPEFATIEFVTGGMGTTRRGGPLFIIDDRWLVTRPNHLGRGKYTDLERRVYLPQWLQHEFFHHLYRTYPALGLEAKPHRWFDRSTWPADFTGRYEPDYYAESLHKRLQLTVPRLSVALRTGGPPRQLLARLTEADVVGRYVREPMENGYHDGTIARGTDGRLRWTNAAGVSWSLTPALGEGRLATGPDNPYYARGGRTFEIEMMRDANGALTGRVRGFRFMGELYIRR